ncbi:MAG: siphovirus Gp157 family protein [Peptostreptococcus porci]|nr:siphovirus Gp157 family protein [Peptostreptococcus porci]
MSLYDLTKDLKELEEQIELVTFTEDPESEEVLQAMYYIKETINSLIQDKSADIIRLVREWDVEIINLENEIDRLQELKFKRKKRVENLKEYLKICIENAGITKVQTALGDISIRKGAGKVNIFNGEMIPEEFKRETIKIDFDKKAIKEKIKAGETVEGAELVIKNSLIVPKAPKEK